ncbi:alpha/beta hydrolase [Nocardioides dongxiaopingii]|uniref:alpha/beta hydrolase n=1 Tax=Nocardioides sp. S-1144 TaxID=2582905 RepID=UPI00110DB1BC|nr:alpha/beta hydrolase [Nocardioides sp. S-1144]QCW50678.1 alpha/beta hydrolase [Nocardioides sp. S-1144]
MHPDRCVDVLGEPWTAETIGLAPDAEGPVVATLVSRRAENPNGRAVLYVHGFADYFFQTEYAAWWLERGYDFYALDLRKYGRSIRPHQTPTYVDDVHTYFAELDLAWWRITERDGHDAVVVSAHSTGGLITPLWADSRQMPELAGMVLNSPWFDLQGAPWMRSPVTSAVLDRVGQRQPMRVLGKDANGIYGRSLHREHGGEWDYDLEWKPVLSYPVRFGWLRAIRRAHAELHAGLSVLAPVLVLSSAATLRPPELDDDVYTHDIVLDVPQIRRWATSVGPHVTYAAIDGAVHDVVLSRPPVRAMVYDQLERWVGAYLT